MRLTLKILDKTFLTISWISWCVLAAHFGKAFAAFLVGTG